MVIHLCQVTECMNITCSMGAISLAQFFNIYGWILSGPLALLVSNRDNCCDTWHSRQRIHRVVTFIYRGNICQVFLGKDWLKIVTYALALFIAPEIVSPSTTRVEILCMFCSNIFQKLFTITIKWVIKHSVEIVIVCYFDLAIYGVFNPIQYAFQSSSDLVLLAMLTFLHILFYFCICPW